MNRILKYPCDVGNLWKIPKHAKVIHVGEQRGIPTIWAIVDHEEETLPPMRPIIICGTGQPCPPPECHLGTVMSGPFVWHVFEEAGE